MESFLQQANAIAWYRHAILVLVFLALVIWWLFRQVKQMEKKALSEEPARFEKARSWGEPSREDDLTRIEGIGPKVAKVLNEAGIKNFDSLSHADPGEVKNVLNQAGLQMMNPEGWIEQAELAAKEDWDGLQKLQAELKGGRRK